MKKNTALMFLLIGGLLAAAGAFAQDASVMPIRYEVVPAPEGFLPDGEVVEMGGVACVGCEVYRDEGGYPRKQGDRAALWEISDAASVDLWWTEDEEDRVLGFQPTGDDFVMLTQRRLFRKRIWLGFDDERFVVREPAGYSIGSINRLLPEGYLLGGVMSRDDQLVRPGAVWDLTGQPQVLAYPGMNSIRPVDQSGGFIVGVMKAQIDSDADSRRPFIWTQEAGVREIPLPDDFICADAVGVDAAGRVLIRAKQARLIDGETRQTYRPYLWSAQGGWDALPVPERGSASPIGMNESGLILLRWNVRDNEGEPDSGKRGLCVVSLEHREPLHIPAVHDGMRDSAHALSDNGMIVVQSSQYVQGRGNFLKRTEVRGSVLRPVYPEAGAGE